jgi:hypothetical protein
MFMSNRNRKSIYFFAGVLCMAFVVFVGMNINKKDKIDNSSDSLVGKRTSEQCQEQISKMNIDELTQYVLNLSDISLNNRIERFKAIRNMEFFSRYLFCKFEQSNDIQEKENIFNNASLIIEQGSRNKGRGSEVNSVAKENFKNPNGSFIRTIALENFDDFCPDELPKMCARENGIFFEETSEWCENICSTLERYKNNEDVFNREIMNFSSDGISIKDKMLVYVWRMDFAFGLGGEEKALKVCDAAPGNIYDQCTEYAKRIKIWNMDCENFIEKLGDALCID